MIYVYCIVIPVLGCCLMCLVAGFIIYRKRKQMSLDDMIEGAEPYKTNSVDAIVEESQVTTEFFIMKRMETRIVRRRGGRRAVIDRWEGITRKLLERNAPPQLVLVIEEEEVIEAEEIVEIEV